MMSLIYILDHKKQKFHCPRCNFPYTRKSNLKIHLKKTSCGLKLEEFVDGEDHFSKHATEFQKSSWSYVNDIFMPEQWDPKINHSVTEFCRKFPKSIPNLKNIKGPKGYLQSDVLAYHCKVCPTRFFYSRSLSTKYNSDPKMEQLSLECAKCDQCFKKPGGLLNHMYIYYNW